MMATNVVNDKWTDVDPKRWTPKIYRALQDCSPRTPEVERVLANPAIKKALCRDVKGDRSWLHKIRPVAGPQLPSAHPDLVVRRTARTAKAQPVTPTDEGCGKDLDRVVVKKNSTCRRARSRSRF